MMIIKPQLRAFDDFGAGEYGAPRGNHKHRGNDWVCMPGSYITAIRGGAVTKLGYCYSENLTFRYVEVKTADLENTPLAIYCRYLYVEPTVKVGDWISRGDTIGHAQDVAAYHMEGTDKSMMPHIHVETFRLVDGDREYFDSRDFG
jgi:hypothetical protein